jgi:hypothetical protein
MNKILAACWSKRSFAKDITQVCVDDKPAACVGQAVCDTPAPPNCTTVTNGFGMLMFGNIASILVVTDRV